MPDEGRVRERVPVLIGVVGTEQENTRGKSNSHVGLSAAAVAVVAKPERSLGLDGAVDGGC